MKGTPIEAVVDEVNSPAIKWNKYVPENNSEHFYMSGFMHMELDKRSKDESPKGS